MSDVTHILAAIDAGDPHAAAQLLPLVYDELRKLAAGHMANEKPGHTLDATALVHEAYLRLVGDQRFENRRHFFAAAAEAMRRILVDNARRKASLKRGGDRRRNLLDDVPAPDPDHMLLALDEALNVLAASDPVAVQVVQLHHFAGLSQEQTAEMLDLTVYQVRQKWSFVRAWLKTQLTDL